MLQSFIDSTAGSLINITDILGSPVSSKYFCWLPNMCDVYPKESPIDIGLSISFDKETRIQFLDANLWKFDSKSVRIVAKKGEEVLHDFEMQGVAAAMELYINQDGSIDGNVQKLHFTGGEIVNPGALLVDPKQIGWIAGTFQYLEALANQDGGLNCDHLRPNELLFGVYAKTQDLQFRDGYMYYGFNIDPIYIGKP